MCSMPCAVIDSNDCLLPAAARELARLLLDQIARLSEKIAGLDADLRWRVTNVDTARPLTTISGEARSDVLGEQPFDAFFADPPAPADQRKGVDRRGVLQESVPVKCR